MRKNQARSYKPVFLSILFIALSIVPATAVPPEPEEVKADLVVGKTFHSVPASRVKRLEGFVGQRIDANRRRLKTFDIFKYVRMLEEKDHRQWWWIGEQPGKWLESAVLSAERASDQALLETGRDVLNRMVAAQEPGGYLGITDPAIRTTEKPLRGMDAYELYFTMHGLLTAHETWDDKTAMKTAEDLGDYFVRHIGPGKAEFWPSDLRPPENVGKSLGGHSAIAGHSVHYGWEGTLLIDPMMRLYKLTDDPAYLEWCQWVVSRIDEWSGHDALSKLDNVAAGEMGIHEIQPYVHAHTFHMNFQGLLRLYQVTGDRSLFRKVAGAWRDIADRQMYITGGVSVGEHYEPGHHLPITGNVVETCASMSWLQLSQYLLELTGDPKYADAIEKLVWNHAFASQTADGTSNRYHTPLNGTKPAGYFHGPDCCTASGHRMLARLPSLVYGVGDDGVYVNQFVESRTEVKLPGGGTTELKLETDYPEGEIIRINVTPDEPHRFPLKVRLPAWCDNPSVWVTGEELSSLNPGTYRTISRKWQQGDTVEIKLPMNIHRVKGTHTTEGRISLKRGPVVFALDTVRWTDRQREMLDRVPDDLGAMVGLAGDTLTLKTEPAGTLGPVYEATVQLPNLKKIQVPIVPFANIGQWWERGEERPSKNARAYAYAVWFYGGDSEEFRRRAADYREQQKLMRTIKWDLESGDWRLLQDGNILAQTSLRSDCRAFARGFSGDDYTYHVKAKKTRGTEGFVVIFRARDHQTFYWWNVAGWGNTQHAIERETEGDREVIASEQGSIENGRWYDIRIELRGPRIRCYLDGELIHDIQDDGILRGGIGLGAWQTAVEYKDVKVTDEDGNVLYRRF